ncbi:MAG: peptidase [Moraxellaceae bacterium]|jgi:predicted Zn-dependent protease|nr:peptidase [Moraxellaceae bacterium]
MNRLLTALLLLCALSAPAGAERQGSELPELGDAVSATISPEQEYRLGRAFLRHLRGSTPTVNDPLVQDYLERLCYRLAFHGPLQHPDLSLVIIRDRGVNAFAVPGGIIGVNVGLLLTAENEAELGSVLAHELGHLSQRHFARQLAESKQSQWLYLAGLLSTLALAAAGDGQSAAAMSATTTAAMVDKRLSYSRQYEQEADRIGMQTLADAGLDPHAMPAFFQRLERQTRMSTSIPEFVLTHPLTGSRIADTFNRAQQYPKRRYQDTLDYQLARLRFRVQFMPDSFNSVAHFQRLLANDDAKADRARVNRLGLVLALTRQKQFAEAREAVAPLLAGDAPRADFVIAAAEIELAERRYAEALRLLEPVLALNPDNYPLRMYFARAQIANGQPEQAINRLEALARERDDDIQIWRLLIDAYTGAKNALGVQRSKAEVYFLSGDDEHALKQLQLAADSVKGNYQITAKIQKRMREMQQAKEDIKL